MSVFVKNLTFAQKSQFCSKISMLFKNFNFVQQISILFNNFNFVQIFQFCSKISILFKNFNFVQKFQFCSKISILLKNFNFAQKFQFCSKILIFLKYCRQHISTVILKRQWQVPVRYILCKIKKTQKIKLGKSKKYIYKISFWRVLMRYYHENGKFLIFSS